MELWFWTPLQKPFAIWTVMRCLPSVKQLLQRERKNEVFDFISSIRFVDGIGWMRFIE
jgi:hypothetical protein